MGDSMGEQMRYISLFSGVEACSVAWYHMKNWQAQAFAEFDEFPSAVLKHQFPHVPNVGDVTKHEWKQYKGKCELIVGGSPCQSFSVAGQRLGLDDPRGNLALHFLRVVKEVQPTWFIFENVAGLLSSDDGRDFAAFLAEVENIGYGCAYRILDAQYFGVPQRRRRVFVVGHIDGDWRRAAAVLFEPGGLSGHPPTSKQKKQDHTANAQSSVGVSSGRGINTLLDNKPAGALTTEMYHRGGYGNQSVDTHAVLVPCGVDLFNQEETGEVHAALRTAQGHGAPAVMYENHAADSRIKEVVVAPTMTAKYGTGGGNVPLVNHAVMDQNLIVRRLTPLECERLQGFPDNWTQIPWKGKPKEKCPDSHRFKAMGNSMAVPVMRWIGEGIELVNRIPRTEAPQQEELGWL